MTTAPTAPDTIALAIADAARAVGVSESLARRRIRERSLPCLPVGGRVLLLRGDIDSLARWPARPAETDGRRTIATAFEGRTVLRVDEAAHALSVSSRTVDRLIGRGELPASRETGRWFIDVAELRRWLLARRVPAHREASR